MKLTAVATFALFLISSKPGLCQGNSTEIALQRALHFLTAQQDESGKFSDSTNQLFDVWETILAVDALQHLRTSEYQLSVQSGLAYLQNHENPQALICHNSKCKEATCIETSAYYLELLRHTPDLNIEKRLAHISEMQEENGSWTILNPDVSQNSSFVSVTAFVVHLFESYAYTSYSKKTALEYIAAKQLPDGSWGQSWEYYNCPGYALWQCLRVLKQEPEYAAEYQRGLAFIADQQLENGSWQYRDPSIENTTSPELQTALMLRCLVGAHDPSSIRALKKGIDFLLQAQLPNGSWDGGYFPIPNARYKKKEYLLATTLIIQSLFDVLNGSQE